MSNLSTALRADIEQGMPNVEGQILHFIQNDKGICDSGSSAE
jgi:hypothetical protein